VDTVMDFPQISADVSTPPHHRDVAVGDPPSVTRSLRLGRDRAWVGGDHRSPRRWAAPSEYRSRLNHLDVRSVDLSAETSEA